jgi:hypothetical protein
MKRGHFSEKQLLCMAGDDDGQSTEDWDDGAFDEQGGYDDPQ